MLVINFCLGKRTTQFFLHTMSFWVMNPLSIAQQILADAGYKVSVDPHGVHRITFSTMKIISKLVNKE